jgi:hypothetical protein
MKKHMNAAMKRHRRLDTPYLFMLAFLPDELVQINRNGFDPSLKSQGIGLSIILTGAARRVNCEDERMWRFQTG